MPSKTCFFWAAFVFCFDFAGIFTGISRFFCTESIRVVLVFFLGGEPYPLGNEHITTQGMFEDKFPFPNMGYVSSMEGKNQPLRQPLSKQCGQSVPCSRMEGKLWIW